jgi:hypothetical protein
MYRNEDGTRIVGVNGREFTFERTEPEKAGRKIGDREVVALWVSPLQSRHTLTNATVNEFDDGILYGPSSVPGTFSDFPGAAAAEVTVRWLELANEHLVGRLKRQREIMAVAAGILAAIAIVAVAFR